MNVRIKPGRLKGEVIIPPSKSLAHRAIIAASLANGISKITNIAYSEDIKATIEGMKALGANIECYSDYLLIKGSNVERIKNVIDANESGSTLRFLIPIALINKEEITFVGHNRLLNRPLDVYYDLFEKKGIAYSHPKDAYLPLKLNGSLKPGIYEVPGNVSSQFITGLLYTLPLLNGDSKIIITTKLESKGYIDLTVDILRRFGITIDVFEEEIDIKGNQNFKPCDYQVEGDFSQSAFFFLANMLGNDIILKGMNLASFQGDKKIISDISDFGGVIKHEAEGLKALPINLHSANISFAQSPDLGPALTVLASTIRNERSHFYDASRLRIKECDRISAMKEEVERLGGHIEEFPDGMDIYGSSLHGGVVSSHNDHRVVMALAMLSTVVSEDLVIEGAEAVNKSYPNFFEVLASLGGVISYE